MVSKKGNGTFIHPSAVFMLLSTTLLGKLFKALWGVCAVLTETSKTPPKTLEHLWGKVLSPQVTYITR